MYFSNSLLATFVSALYIAGGVRADDCDDSPADSHRFMGYPGKPGHFCDTKWKAGAVVTGIEVWATAWQIKGIRLEFSDTTDAMQGQREGDRHDVMRWATSDKVTAMKLAVNYAGDGLGLVHVEAGGKTLDVRSDTGSFNGDSFDVASGILLGHSGEAGGFVTNWSPLFMGVSDGSAKITDIKFDDDLDAVNSQQKNFNNAYVTHSYIINSNSVNDTDADQSWTFAGQGTVTTSSTMSTTSESVFSMSESIEIGTEIGIPEVADISVKSTTTVGFQMSTSNTQESMKGYQSMVGTTQGSHNDGGLLKPQRALNCSTTATSGTYDGTYKATVQITVKGKQYTLLRPGKFHGVSWTNALTDCNNIAIKDIPDGSKTIEAKDTIKDSKDSKRSARVNARQGIKFSA